MEVITQSTAFELAWKFLSETNENIFLTGKAGTGKTTFLKYLRKHSPKNIVVAAPTGVAAIHAGGVTLHSLFQLPFGPFIPEEGAAQLLAGARLHKEKLKVLRNMELLIIDEASMVASHTVDAIDTLLRSVRRNSAPFGGVQVLFIGDLHQLPPVVKRDEWEILQAYYSSVFFFDSRVLRDHVPIMIELTTVFRQKDDRFINLLNGLRGNSLTADDLNLLNSRLDPEFLQKDESREGYIILTTHNHQADSVNRQRLLGLKGSSVSYRAKTKGDFPEKSFPAEEYLELKVGAQVMFLKNDTERQRYFNGKIGVVTRLDDESVKVACEGDKDEIEVTFSEWQNLSYSIDEKTKEVKEEEKGSFRQLPLRLAWAVTIHKSQGLTFDKLVVDAENAFASGQVYVALSRCRTLEGLVLTSPVNRNFLGASRDLVAWKERNHREEELEARFTESKNRFEWDVLQSVFKWDAWLKGFGRLKYIMAPIHARMPEAARSWFTELGGSLDHLRAVSDKFIRQISANREAGAVIEGNPVLQERVISAAQYFEPLVKDWYEKLAAHPIALDVKKDAKDLDGAIQDLGETVGVVLQRIRSCRKGFSLQEFVVSSRRDADDLKKIPSVYGGSDKPAPDLSTDHPELYVLLSKFRKELAAESDAPLFSIFPNKTMAEICRSLPETIEDLKKVKGIGKMKAQYFGEDVLQIVNAYCRQNGVDQDAIRRKVVKEKQKEREEKVKQPGATVFQTLEIFRETKSIEQTAMMRNLVTGTIESHLAQAIAGGEITIEEVLPAEELMSVRNLLPENPLNVPFGELKKQLPDWLSYGRLRMILASIRG